MPKGAGASGAPIAVVPEAANKVPDEVLNPQPGSGQGAGGGDGMGRLRFKDQAGKAHERGTGKMQRKSKEAPDELKESKPTAPPAKVTPSEGQGRITP
jgi:hypothetical protein